MASDKKLDLLLIAINKLASKEVAPVAPVAPVLPLAPINNGDHDLLTKLDTKVDQIQMDVTALKAQNSVYVTRTEHQEVVRIQADHEARIRIVEVAMVKIMQWGTIAVLLLGVAEFILTHYWK